jgi:hypothetical protein
MALGASGCGKSRAARAEAEAKERDRIAAEETKRHLEEKQRELEKKKAELERSADIYGTPPLPDAGTRDAGAAKQKNCNCNRADPLCDCL